MADMMEVMFSCDSEDKQNSCGAWDYRTGTNLMTYKGGGNLQAQTLQILRSEYVLAANNSKPLIHVWPINGQEQFSSVRFVVPGRINALSISPDGYFLVAGIQEIIYIWHLTTGLMLNSIAKHYQQINCIRFTDDGSHFATAGKDGSVLVWNLTQVATPHAEDNQSALYTFTDNGLPVTDIHIGAGGLRAYMTTVSLDRTCKIYDLNSGTLLLNVVFAEGLQCVTCNALETSVYVGTTEGNIYEFNIDSVPRTKEYHVEEGHTNKFVGHQEGTAINRLVLSLDGETLVSGGQDQKVCLWNIPSRQLLKTMAHKGAVTNLVLRLTDPAIFSPEHKQPHVFCGNLKRMIEPSGADDDQIIEVLVKEDLSEGSDMYKDWPSHSYYNSPGTTTTIYNPKKHESEKEEIAKLRAEIADLKRTNKKLFDISVKHVFGSKKT